MKKTKVLALLIATIFFTPCFVFCQTAEEKKDATVEEGKNEKHKQNELMASIMMQLLGSMQKQIAPTNDGGVIVFSGNKLLKYDKDLNLIKEVEVNTQFDIKIDPGSMQEMFKSMKGKKKSKAEGQETEK